MAIYITYSPEALKEAGRTFEGSVLPIIEYLGSKFSESIAHHGFPPSIANQLRRLFSHQVKYHNGGSFNLKGMIKKVRNYKTFVIGKPDEHELELLREQNADIDFLEWANEKSRIEGTRPIATKIKKMNQDDGVFKLYFGDNTIRVGSFEIDNEGNIRFVEKV